MAHIGVKRNPSQDQRLGWPTRPPMGLPGWFTIMKGLPRWQPPGPCAKDFQPRPAGSAAAMPRFAANLAYLFTERPLLERFAAAAAAGFTAVELQFPYDHAPSAIKAELVRHGLTQLGVNTALGPCDGDSGLAAVPGRERDWDVMF